MVWTARPDAPPATGPVVLLVEDEPEIREIEAHVLRQAGFAVLPVGSSMSALQLVEAEMPVDIVVADVNMPGMTGEDLALRLRRLRPALKILFVTALPDDLFEQDGLMLWNDEAYLGKPFTGDGLIEAVSLLLCGTITH